MTHPRRSAPARRAARARLFARVRWLQDMAASHAAIAQDYRSAVTRDPSTSLWALGYYWYHAESAASYYAEARRLMRSDT